MERGQMKAILMGLVVMGGVLAMEESKPVSSFTICYESCFILCFILPYSNSAFYCSLKCLADCIIPSSSSSSSSLQEDHRRHNQFFCELGCASSLCSHLSTKENPGGEKVESCVKSCSQTCTRD